MASHPIMQTIAELLIACIKEVTEAKLAIKLKRRA
jgi:hypothetical protein